MQGKDVEVLKSLLPYINRNDVDVIVAEMAREHRTIQQNFTALCVAWLEELARKAEAGDFDLRNEAACNLGKRFVGAVPALDRILPYI